MKALIFLAHGSKVAETNETLTKYIEALQAKAPYDIIKGAYLQLMEPDLHSALEDVAAAGATAVDIFPFFLFKGNHILSDIPAEIETAMSNHPGLKIRFMDSIGYDPLMVDLILERLNKA